MATSVFFHSCEYIQDLGFKNTSVFTIPVSSITSISALTGGVVRAGGESPVKVRGVCWSTEKNPSADLSTRTFDSTAAISFTSHLNNLLPNTVYFVKAYAENSQGVYYGNEISFKTTQPTVPSLISVKPSFITSSSAISGGEIINDGGSLIRSRGVCWSTLDNPTASPGYKTVDSTGTGLYISRVFGLGANKKYYVRAYAVNSVGTAYGDQISFITSPAALAIIKTGFPADITQNTVSVEGNVSDDGGSQVTVRGICWGENPDPTTDKCSKTTNGSGSGNFSAVITGLAAGKKYYARAYAINSPGISYGNPVSFQTGLAGLPVLTTLLPGTIAYSTAQCAGNVISDGGAPVTERGICWSTNENPSILLSTKTIDGTGTGTFACAISGLKASTFYYVRAYATGIAGTGYGSQIIFKTLSPTVPLVSTGLVSEVTLTGAKAEGLVSSDGGVEVSERGICLGTTKNGSVDQDTKIFIRDDDAGVLSEEFLLFHQMVRDLSVPVVYAVVPSWVDKRSAAFFLSEKKSAGSSFDLVQHGWAHINYADKNDNKYEFGPRRTYQQQEEDIGRGKDLLRELFGEHCVPAFVPPFHGFDSNTVGVIEAAAFKIFSAGRNTGFRWQGVIDLPAGVYLNEYVSDGRSFCLDGKQALRRLSSALKTAPLTGCLFHHEAFQQKEGIDQIYFFLRAVAKLRERGELDIIRFSDLCREGRLAASPQAVDTK